MTIAARVCRSIGAAVLLVTAVAGGGCGGSATTTSDRRDTALPARATETPTPDRVGTRAFGPAVGFHSRRQLAEHFEKHGAEFNAASEHEYLREAQQLRDARAGGHILEAVRADGVITRFDRRTGAFIAFDDDGTIRTFFKPNLGERYFRRQAERGEERR